MVMPCTKYFCTKGYASTMGPVTTTVRAIFSVCVGRETELMTELLTLPLEISFL